MDSREEAPPVFDRHEPPLGELIRADPAPTLKYAIVGVAGVMAGVVIGCVFAHRNDGHSGPAPSGAPASANQP